MGYVWSLFKRHGKYPLIEARVRRIQDRKGGDMWHFSLFLQISLPNFKEKKIYRKNFNNNGINKVYTYLDQQ